MEAAAAGVEEEGEGERGASRSGAAEGETGVWTPKRPARPAICLIWGMGRVISAVPSHLWRDSKTMRRILLRRGEGENQWGSGRAGVGGKGIGEGRRGRERGDEQVQPHPDSIRSNENVILSRVESPRLLLPNLWWQSTVRHRDP